MIMKNNRYKNIILKRLFDILFSVIGLITFGLVIIIFVFLSTIETNSNGLFFQKRVGYRGKLFKIIKIKTMYIQNQNKSSITLKNDPRITKIGKFMRRFKIDELPQLINILKGDMSFVGPRPDLPEIINQIPKHERDIILSVKPGVTCLSSIDFINEENSFTNENNSIEYIMKNIMPKKIKLNIDYINNMNLKNDIFIIIKTIIKIITSF